MAAARHRNRIRVRTRRAPLALRLLRAAAALGILGLGGLIGFEVLRDAGFRPRWAAERALPGSGRSRAVPSPGRPTEAVAGLGRLPPTARPSPVGSGAPADIDFERFPDGAAVCAPCPVSEQWAEQGLRLSFRSWSSDSPHPFVLDARNFLPPGSSTHALGPALRSGVGLEVGVLQLDFPGRPRKIAFTLVGPDLIGSFDLKTWSDGDIIEASSILRALQSKYRPAGRGVFRAERIVVETPRGIDRIWLDGWGPPGHVLLVDDLIIGP